MRETEQSGRSETVAATTLWLAGGIARTVRGRAEDVGAALRARTLGGDDGLRAFITTDGETITVASSAVILTEAAKGQTTGAFGFARALQEGDE